MEEVRISTQGYIQNNNNNVRDNLTNFGYGNREFPVLSTRALEFTLGHHPEHLDQKQNRKVICQIGRTGTRSRILRV